ncbi:unnamed protein product [Pseudo-nitzschia multistriata]|uniref:Uncharacterized protein n=1 Tax=Pseudo-nitzschia multistriata TaxID=183589 RepID=A0A448ZB65_9STRA|nr:unnamed protein product [Pseudo-nitzschia multistriata]
MAAGGSFFFRGAVLLAAGVALMASGGSDSLRAAAFSAPSPARTGRIDNPLSALEPKTEATACGQETTTTTTAAANKAPAAAVSLGLALAVGASALAGEPANAYIPSDYASETVQTSIQDLKKASGNVDETFKVYESIAGIITEGKGVGGQINYKGIQLERGYVADEDTTIYNPGLSLLTESEKERLVEAVIDARKAGLEGNQWSENNEYAFEFLRQKLDPFHITELRGFLGIVPFYGAAIYLAVLAVQQLFRDGFQIAYLVGVAAFFLPIVGLVLAGP